MFLSGKFPSFPDTSGSLLLNGVFGLFFTKVGEGVGDGVEWGAGAPNALKYLGPPLFAPKPIKQYSRITSVLSTCGNICRHIYATVYMQCLKQ